MTLEDKVHALRLRLFRQAEEFGFAEIWAADHSEIEVWDDTPLFGIWPERWWGRLTEGRLSGKPYG